ncbi:TonB-dependent receptor [Novosphingobium sp. SG707]|uniref:TonB-dependent receptor n=1 Tax=Novosphingobium sp. SG707 TaxID=2586996 RepID=UPI001B300157
MGLSRHQLNCASVLALGIVISAPAAAQAAAQTTAVDFHIARQSLPAAMAEFSRQSGVQILFPYDQFKGIITNPVEGRMTPERAVAALISGTGVTASPVGARSIALRLAVRAHAPEFRPIALTTQSAGFDAGAPGAAPEPAPAADPASAITVVGSQIKGAKINEAVPVTVMDLDQIKATGAVSGDDLLRSIPQMGDVSFNSTSGQTSSNFARGDVGSINLRNLGVGSTLVLLNGRRMVAHPGSQADENLAPVITYNSNTIPVAGLQRVEVLRDGAAALYGADAVAGVVNTVTRGNVEGGYVDLQYGGAQGTHLRDLQVSGLLGHNFAEGRGNFSLNFSYVDRTALEARDQDFTASADKRALFAGTGFAGLNSLDLRSTLSNYGDFAAIGRTSAITSNGSAVTSASGTFHIQPTTNSGCKVTLANGVCVDTGTRATSGADRNLRWDGNANNNISVSPAVRRLNLFGTWHYDLNDDITAFGELGYYMARSSSVQDSVFSISSIPMAVPASNYWNPFGATTLPGGGANPNRIAGLNIGAAGLPVTISSIRLTDLGPTYDLVDNSQFRALAGLRGQWHGFDWESALLYSEATVIDKQNGVSATALQNQLALSTPDAYNPFGTSANTQAAVDAIKVVSVRRDRTTLASADFKASRKDLFHLPGGDVGVAFGGEVRRDTQLDDRDARVDGTVTWTNTVTGVIQPSDLYGVSPTPDTRGSRVVAATYAEFAIPLISPDMHVPLVRSLDLQAAGRYEHYSDFGSVAKPKFAASWDVVDGLRLRGSWAQGFKAPNLEVMNASIVTRGNTRVDYVRCEADLRAGRITSFANCAQSYVATAQRSGNPNLRPEESTSWSLGAVLEPKFLPPSWGRLTLTVDYWAVKQKGIVGVFGEGNALILDYLLRQQGSSNPNVIRLAPTADDVALYANTGLAAAGQVQYVKDQYVNLQPQDVRGLDISLTWRLRGTRFGDFTLTGNGAHLIRFYRAPSPQIQQLLDARATGLINAGTIITGGGSLLGQDGRPAWKAQGSLTWKLKGITVGGSVQYTGAVWDTSAVDASGNYWRVKAQTTGNLYAQYEFDKGALKGTSIRFGARNITDEKPPLAISAFGYMGALYQGYGRYLYGGIRREF